MTINPYQPTLLPDPNEDPNFAASHRMFFDGRIEREDYERLLPNSRLLGWLQVALLLVIVPLLAGALLLALASIIKDGMTSGAFITLGVSVMSLAVAIFAVAAMRRRWRSRKYLSHFPDILGPARGEFNNDGLLMHDGVRQHWFGPTFLSASKVFKAGIRVPLPQVNPYRYLAITSRLFDAYSHTQAKQLQAVWRKNAVKIIATDAHRVGNPIANRWTVAIDPPEGAISFSGYFSSTESSKSEETKQQVISETFGFIGIFIAVIALATYDNPLFWGAIMFLFVSGFSGFFTWRKYLYGTVDQSWYQYGWVSVTQIATCHNELGTLIERGEISSIDSNDQMFSLTTHENSQLFIFREHVSGDAAWLRLGELLTT